MVRSKLFKRMDVSRSQSRNYAYEDDGVEEYDSDEII